jgi:hypothetical protein
MPRPIPPFGNGGDSLVTNGRGEGCTTDTAFGITRSGFLIYDEADGVVGLLIFLVCSGVVGVLGLLALLDCSGAVGDVLTGETLSRASRIMIPP